MKKYIVAIPSFLGILTSFAETTSSYDFTTATTELTSLSTAIVAWAKAALPIVAGIAGAFLLFFLVRLVIRLVKSWASKAA